MILSDIISLGDKIDIQLVQQLEQQERGESVEPIRTYKSSLFDYLQEKEIEIAMPTENGRMVLFQVGLQCKMIFYTKKGVYTCFGVVRQRYKKDNFFMLAVLITSELIKLQRREFFRVESTLDLLYVPVSDEMVTVRTTEELLAKMKSEKAMENAKKAISLDISGGGIRFVTEDMLRKDSLGVVIIHLAGEKIDRTFYLITRIIDSTRSQKNFEKCINRGMFLFRDLRDREAIVRFVFDEERRIRRKEMGQ